MDKLRKSLSFRGYPDNSLITYYDGEEKEIITDKFHYFWELLESLGANNEEAIAVWKEKYKVQNEEYEQILDLLKANNLLDQGIFKEESDFYKRNLNFLSTYGWNTDDILIKMSDLTIVIIGAGTIGSSIAYTFAKMGVGTIIIYDSDFVENKNIPAQFVYDIEDSNHLKVKALKNKIFETNPNIEIVIYDKRVEKIEDLEESLTDHNVDYVFSCFDEGSIDLYRNLVNKTSELGIKTIVLGYAYDLTIAYVLKKTNIDFFINNSIISFDKDFLITENRGTMLQSLVGSFFAARILLGETGLMPHEHKEAYTLNVKTLELQILNSIEELVLDSYVNNLNTIYQIL